VCSTGKAIAVAPAPAATLDSVARAAFALVERVAARRGLTPQGQGEALRETCLVRQSFTLCGQVNGPEVQLSMSQVKTIGFSPWADSLRTELLDSLRVEFGASRVRECKWKWDGNAQRWGCPPLRSRDDN
jgi:hypothetical protein